MDPLRKLEDNRGIRSERLSELIPRFSRRDRSRFKMFHTPALLSAQTNQNNSLIFVLVIRPAECLTPYALKCIRNPRCDRTDRRSAAGDYFGPLVLKAMPFKSFGRRAFAKLCTIRKTVQRNRTRPQVRSSKKWMRGCPRLRHKGFPVAVK